MTLTVLHVLVPEPPGELGGADMHLLDLAVHQADVGLRPVVMERGSPEFASRLAREGVEVVSASGLTFRQAVRALNGQVASLGPDIVHAHGYDADYWAASAKLLDRAAFRRRPLVFTQHGVVEDTPWHRMKTTADAICTRFADGIIACADELVPRMRRWCPHGVVEYIPNGVRDVGSTSVTEARAALADRFNVPTHVPLIGYVGRLAKEKRPDRVLSIVSWVREAGEQVHLLLAGSGALGPSLQRLANDLSIGEAVTFTGLVEDIGVVYGGIDVLVLLSDTEGTSRVLIEAMMQGVPVVASAVGGTPDLLGHGRFGYLVPAGDEGAARAALCQVLRSPAGRTAAAKEHARAGHGAAVMASKVLRLYRALLARQGGAIER